MLSVFQWTEISRAEALVPNSFSWYMMNRLYHNNYSDEASDFYTSLASPKGSPILLSRKEIRSALFEQYSAEGITSIALKSELRISEDIESVYNMKSGYNIHMTAKQRNILPPVERLYSDILMLLELQARLIKAKDLHRVLDRKSIENFSQEVALAISEMITASEAHYKRSKIRWPIFNLGNDYRINFLRNGIGIQDAADELLVGSSRLRFEIEKILFVNDELLEEKIKAAEETRLTVYRILGVLSKKKKSRAQSSVLCKSLFR